MIAEIITIGDEILIGQTVDTNSAWIAKRFNRIGIKVRQIVSIPDDRGHILQALGNAVKNAEIVIVTGGLGPTNDDITKSVLVEFMKDELIFNQEVFSHIESYFLARGREVGEQNRMQAYVPSRSVVLPNRNGTAPGMWMEDGPTVVVSLPGVPYEMKSIMSDYVLDRLSLRSNRLEILHKHIHTQGIPESALMVLIEEWEKALPPPLKLAYLPSPGMVKLRISAEVHADRNGLERLVEAQLMSLELIIPQYITGYDDDTLEVTVGNMLRKNGLTLATAESCTGGYIAHLITSVAGSSDYFRGSIVAYHNEVKQHMLNVPEEILAKYGAVSREVAEAMVRGALAVTGADIAIATTGIAGPAGGSEEKPVGTVWIAIGSANRVQAKKFLFGNERGSNIERAAVTALNMLRKELLLKSAGLEK